MLSDARALYGRGSLRSAGDRAYYAMFNAARAALAHRGIKGSRSHKGLRSQFSQEFVKTGIVDREYSKSLTRALDIRLLSTYEAHTSVSDEEVRDVIDRAERFVDRIKQLVYRT